MDNKDKDNEQKSVYSIPGVIIPAQTTENGQVIESAIGSEILNKEVTAVEKAQPEVLDQTKVVNTPRIPSAPIEQQIVPPTNVVNNPSLPVYTVQPSTQEAKVDTNKKQGKNNNIIYIIIIILLIGALGFLGYQNYLAPKEVVDPVKEWQKKRVANKDSLVVKELFNYVNLDGCDNQINFFYGDSQNVKVSDLSDEVRNYLAYRQLKYSDFEKKNCLNYPTALHKNDSVQLWYCGDGVLTSRDSNFNDETGTTLIVSEDSVRNQVNKIFGESTYKAKTFAVSNSARYFYDSKTSSYIYQTFYGENSCKGYSNKLDDAYQQGDDLTIVVKVTNNESKAMQMFYYTFTESSNGNYYFKELNKRNL